MSTIKRGAYFVAVLDFTVEEWAALELPYAELVSAVKQGSTRHPLQIVVNESQRTITLSANTSTWKLGPAEFDVWVLKPSGDLPLPFDYNITLEITQGASR